MGGMSRRYVWWLAAAEAVALYRDLARDNPAHTPHFAKALANYAIMLDRAGRAGEAGQVRFERAKALEQYEGDQKAG